MDYICGMEQRILEFINEHHVLTLAAAAKGDIWCASAFYVFDPGANSFIITSDENTRHMLLALDGAQTGIVSGAIVLETETVGMIRGLQFKAGIKKAGASLLDHSRLLYLKRFPYAILKGGDLWVLPLSELKFTDNRLGFGKKLTWKKPDF